VKLLGVQAEPAGFLSRVGEAIGGLLSSIPSAWNDFFGGVARGAGIDGWVDWAVLILGLALFISAIGGFRKKALFWPLVRGSVGVALMGWVIA